MANQPAQNLSVFFIYYKDHYNIAKNELFHCLRARITIVPKSDSMIWQVDQSAMSDGYSIC